MTKIYEDGQNVVIESCTPSGEDIRMEFYTRGSHVYSAKTDRQVCYGLTQSGNTLVSHGPLIDTIRQEWRKYKRDMDRLYHA